MASDSWKPVPRAPTWPDLACCAKTCKCRGRRKEGTDGGRTERTDEGQRNKKKKSTSLSIRGVGCVANLFRTSHNFCGSGRPQCDSLRRRPERSSNERWRAHKEGEKAPEERSGRKKGEKEEGRRGRKWTQTEWTTIQNL